MATVESVLTELRDYFQRQSAMPMQVDPYMKYWDALRRFFRAQLSKAELDSVLRESFKPEALVLHNKLLLAINAAAEKIVTDTAFSRGYAALPDTKLTVKRKNAGKTGRKHKSKKDAALEAAAAPEAAAVYHPEAAYGVGSSTSPSSLIFPSSSPTAPIVVPAMGGKSTGRLKRTSSGSAGSGRRGSKHTQAGRVYPLYRAPENPVLRRFLAQEALRCRALAHRQVLALHGRMKAIAIRESVAEIEPDAALLLWTATEHLLKRILASTTPTAPALEVQRSTQQNPYRAPTPTPALSDQHEAGLAQLHQQQVRDTQDPSTLLLRHVARRVEIASRTRLRSYVLGSACWTYSAPRMALFSAHSSTAIITLRDLRTLFDIHPAALRSAIVAGISP